MSNKLKLIIFTIHVHQQLDKVSYRKNETMQDGWRQKSQLVQKCFNNLNVHKTVG
jgi:hypothetical protein